MLILQVNSWNQRFSSPLLVLAYFDSLLVCMPWFLRVLRSSSFSPAHSIWATKKNTHTHIHTTQQDKTRQDKALLVVCYRIQDSIKTYNEIIKQISTVSESCFCELAEQSHQKPHKAIQFQHFLHISLSIEWRTLNEYAKCKAFTFKIET